MTAIEIESKAREIRKLVISTITKARGGHAGSSLSEVDILATLFFGIMKFDTSLPDAPDRDRFILSKGHGSEGLYCSLCAAGYFPEEVLQHYLEHDCPLTIHPTRHVPGIEMNTGALGHGFSNAVGISLAAKLQKRDYRTFVLTGDGELQEGSNWEAAMAAAHFALGNLTVIIDNNGLQLADRIDRTMRIEPLEAKFEAFGFDVHQVNGNSVSELLSTLSQLDYKGNKPHALVAKTIKGKGVSFMEGIPEWHHRIPSSEEGEQALKELQK